MSNFVMSVITAGGLMGGAYLVDKVSDLRGESILTTGVEEVPAVKAAEKKADVAESKAQIAESGAEAIIKAFTDSETPSAEKKVDAAQQRIDNAQDRAKKARDDAVRIRERALDKFTKVYEHGGILGDATRKTAVVINGVSQLVISMAVRTLGTVAGSQSESFNQNLKYIIPGLSAVGRGLFDYFLMGKSVGRTVSDAVITTGLEFTGTALVLGFD
jgi:hypothetical protein